MRCIWGGSPADTEAIKVKPVAGYILLGLKHDDVDLGGKHATQHHKATQADWDTHGSCLNLQRKHKKTVISSQVSTRNISWTSIHASIDLAISHIVSSLQVYHCHME